MGLFKSKDPFHEVASVPVQPHVALLAATAKVLTSSTGKGSGSYPVDGFTAAVADADAYEAAGDRFSEERHVTPALQFVPRQTDAIQFLRQ